MIKQELKLNNCYIPVTGTVKSQLNQAYLDFVEESGYNPVIVSFNGWKDIEKIWSKKKPAKNDLLLLPGGGDIDPTSFGFDNIESNSYVSPYRDKFDVAAIGWAFKNRVKIFGICRGLQLFCVSQLTYSVVYWQHINNHVQTVDRDITSHFAELLDNVLIKYTKDYVNSLIGKRYIPVNSLHHQGIQALAPNKSSYALDIKQGDKKFVLQQLPAEYADVRTRIHARKLNDKGVGIIEALSVYIVDKEFKEEQIFTGVQWHPEELKEQKDIIKLMLK